MQGLLFDTWWSYLASSLQVFMCVIQLLAGEVLSNPSQSEIWNAFRIRSTSLKRHAEAINLDACLIPWRCKCGTSSNAFKTDARERVVLFAGKGKQERALCSGSGDCSEECLCKAQKHLCAWERSYPCGKVNNVFHIVEGESYFLFCL